MFSASLLAMTRESIDQDLVDLAETTAPGSGWTPDQGMTGLLIRSELARRWPNLTVRAFKTIKDDARDGPQLPILRAEPISKDMYIAIFGGIPAMVHVREPNVGVRFGVEENPPGSSVWKSTDATRTVRRQRVLNIQWRRGVPPTERSTLQILQAKWVIHRAQWHLHWSSDRMSRSSRAPSRSRQAQFLSLIS